MSQKKSDKVAEEVHAAPANRVAAGQSDIESWLWEAFGILEYLFATNLS